MIKLLPIYLAMALSLIPVAVEARPILIAHRGASGDRPEHTLAAYALAIEQGADFIEPDLVLTKDGVLVARHENEISETTDVAVRSEFAARRSSKSIDGQTVTGWFTEDFTLAELKTLRAKERLPQLRPANTAYDGQFQIPTFDEVLALVASRSKSNGRRIGIYPETKHPSYFAKIGLPHTPPLLRSLRRAKLTGRDAPVFIQSFEVGNLVTLRRKTKVKLIQLVSASGAPADKPDTSYASMLSPAGLAAIARYADGIGPEKALVIPRGKDGRLGKSTMLVDQAHSAGLKVHVWTMRAENFFLPSDLKTGSDPKGKGNFAFEIAAFIQAGVDGLFSDNVGEARAALEGLR